jgi:hypothetical protein
MFVVRAVESVVELNNPVSIKEELLDGVKGKEKKKRKSEKKSDSCGSSRLLIFRTASEQSGGRRGTDCGG